MVPPEARPFRSALSAAAVSLAVAGGAALMFLPPLVDITLDSTLLIVGLGLAIGIASLLHLVFVGIAAARAGRSAWVWALGALLTFPLGSIIGLIVVAWADSERQAGAAATRG